MKYETFTMQAAATAAALTAFAVALAIAGDATGADLRFEALRLRLAAEEVRCLYAPLAPPAGPADDYVSARAKLLGVEGLNLEHARLGRVLDAVIHANQVLAIVFQGVNRVDRRVQAVLETLDGEHPGETVESLAMRVARTIVGEVTREDAREDVKRIDAAMEAGEAAAESFAALLDVLIPPPAGAAPEPVADDGKKTMGLWRKRGIRGGKFLVLRRDGTVPGWPWFVIGAQDPAASAGLLGYAAKAEELGFDPDYVADVRELAEDFARFLAERGASDPDAKPNRRDDPTVVTRMPASMGSA